MKFTVAGVTYELVAQERMTFAEIDAVERATGMSMAEVERKSKTCVCGHYAGGHEQVRDDEGNVTTLGACLVGCDCEEFSSVLPSRVAAAGLWVSMKREDPTLTYAQAQEFSQDAVTFDEDVEANPTALPAESAPNEIGGSGALAEFCGLHPWDIDRLTGAEFRHYCDYVDHRVKEEG